MSKRSDTLYLSDMLDSVSAIESFIENVDFNAFVSDRKTQSAMSCTVFDNHIEGTSRA